MACGVMGLLIDAKTMGFKINDHELSNPFLDVWDFIGTQASFWASLLREVAMPV